MTLKGRCSISFVPLIAPSTTLQRIQFLASIADSFIYVVSKVSSRYACLSVNLLMLIYRWEQQARPSEQQ